MKKHSVQKYAKAAAGILLLAFVCAGSLLLARGAWAVQNISTLPVGTFYYTLAYSAGSHGSLSGVLTQTVSAGGSGTAVTAVPAPGYLFSGWSDGSTANPRTDTGVFSNKTLTANFQLNSASASLSGSASATLQNSSQVQTLYTLTYFAGSHGTLSGTLNQTVNAGGSGTAVTAVPAIGYVFSNWSDGSTANPRTDTGVLASVAVTANFTSQQVTASTHILSYGAGPNGILSGDLNQVVPDGGNGTSVTAIPNTSYVFSGWSDGLASNPRTDLSVRGNVGVVANFSPSFISGNGSLGGNLQSPSGTGAPAGATTLTNSYTVTYAAGLHGSLSGALAQTVLQGGTGSSVVALPDPNYLFVGWSDGSTANPRVDANVSANKTVTASFILASTSLGGSAGGSGGGYVSGGYISGGSTASVGQVLGSGTCPSVLTITDNLKQGAKNGQYQAYNRKVVTQVSVLQQQINRILATSYSQAAGPVDGSFGPLTKQGVERLQVALNTYLKPQPVLKIDGIVGPFTRAAMNNSCGGS